MNTFLRLVRSPDEVAPPAPTATRSDIEHALCLDWLRSTIGGLPLEDRAPVSVATMLRVLHDHDAAALAAARADMLQESVRQWSLATLDIARELGVHLEGPVDPELLTIRARAKVQAIRAETSWIRQLLADARRVLASLTGGGR